MSIFRTFEMDALGVTLIVGGMAFLCSGLIFLLPWENRLSESEQSIEESQREIDYYLQKMRKERGEL
jgi:hypothetical protein